MKELYLIIFVCLGTLSMNAQTTIVRSFDFGSTTRDTVIEFPDGDHNRFEKILMHYGMRCKDALVSNGTNRNLGCGEWDYSCNTYIVDSTRVDSLKQVGSDYVILGFNGDEFPYQEAQTYSYYQRIEKDVTINSQDIQLIKVSEGNEELDYPFGEAASNLSQTYILQADELTTAGLAAGPINNLNLPFTLGNLEIEGLRVQMQEVDAEDVNELSAENWIEVFHNSTTLTGFSNNLVFYQPFEWSGTQNIAIQVDYGTVRGDELQLTGKATSYDAVSFTRPAYDSYFDFGSLGHVHVADGLEDINEEITISFWQYGNDELPIGSTILEARDTDNLRQFNVHLPWGNSQVYWDCGNDGGGYDRINKTANASDFKGQWNHWAFTKNVRTGRMEIILNGKLWHVGNGKTKAIDAVDMNIGAAIINENPRSYSKMSEFRVWSQSLDADQISEWMHKKLDASHPAYDQLVLYYPLSDITSNEVMDFSPNNNGGIAEGQIAIRDWRIGEAVMERGVSQILPSITLGQGSYDLSVSERIVLDSVPNLPSVVEKYILEGTDRVLESTSELFLAGDMPIYDENNIVVGTRYIEPDDVITFSDINYFSKHTMDFEIMSFVTPYGIGLDFGEEGESWTFDVTDYGPILKGKKRMYMSRGGQWQEEMNIWFEFIEGEPHRDVYDVEQVWPVRSVGWQRIQDDWRYEPRRPEVDMSVDDYILRTTITGHGQQGEFIPRNHSIKLGPIEDRWQVWTECADNPVYPQGGTWIFDRAGWCPGAASDTREFRATDILKFIDTSKFDYNVPTVSGTSNYIVSSQLFSYGPVKREIDLAIEDVINPSNKIEHRRFNPSCGEPSIMIKNYGSTRITQATIDYGIVGGERYSYDWTGSVGYGLTEMITLPYIQDLMFAEDGDMFFAEIMSLPQGNDEYQSNNRYESPTHNVDHYAEDIVVEFRTNSQATETIYRVTDASGLQVFSRAAGLTANTTYRDTIRGLNGCYQLLIQDSDDDGVSFWFPPDATNDGSGFVRIKNIGGAPLVIEPDFGKFSEYNFTAGMVLSTEDGEDIWKAFTMFPNPSDDQVYFGQLDDWDERIEISVIDAQGRLVIQEQVNKYELADGLTQFINIPEGMYIVTLSDRRNKQSQKLVKI